MSGHEIKMEKKKRCWNIQFGSCLFGNERNPWKERWRGRKKLSDRGRRRWLSGGAAGVRKWWAILLYHRIPSPPAAPLTAIWQQQTISNCFLHEGERWVFPSNGGKQTGSKQFDWQTESVRLHLFRLMRSRYWKNLFGICVYRNGHQSSVVRQSWLGCFLIKSWRHFALFVLDVSYSWLVCGLNSAMHQHCTYLVCMHIAPVKYTVASKSSMHIKKNASSQHLVSAKFRKCIFVFLAGNIRRIPTFNPSICTNTELLKQ